jgi:anti-sigma-K factor RskA
MITCQDADVLAAALSVGSLDHGDQSDLQQHLAGCADCPRIAGEYMAAAARLPLGLEPLQPPPELRSRLMRAVYAEAEQAGRRAQAAQTAPWWRRLWAALPSSRGFTVLAGVAAAAVVALAAWTLTTRQNAPPATVSVALRATQGAPNASGQLVYDRGAHQAVLTAVGLPDPATIAGHKAVYEVWVIRTDGVAVPAAYLEQGPDGTWSAALHADMATCKAVAATVEPPGGSRAPTSAPVIEGLRC